MDSIALAVGDHHCPITIAAGLLDRLHTFNLVGCDRQALVVTNQTVAPYYLDKVCAQLITQGAEVNSLVLSDGEQYKRWPMLQKIFTTLLEHQHQRDTTLVALGGGVIGDLTGFAAACYQRGVRYLQLPTTLLAQVDAAIGGKTAINHPLAKNAIGAFHQPAAVLIDPEVLATLPSRQFSSGLAEIIKYGMVLDADFFCWLEQHLDEVRQQHPLPLTTAIRRCCELKAAVVAYDERDHNQRLLLNFGHTFGHAIEAHSEFQGWLHGEAVAVGMVIATAVAKQLGLVDTAVVERLRTLLQRADLPVVAPPTLQAESYWPYLLRDKKGSEKQLRLVLPTAVGQAAVVGQIDRQVLQAAMTACSR